MSAEKSPLFLAYFGDDLTGSTDALETLALAGLKTVLFLRTPRPADLARHPGIKAVGVAGLTRAMGTEALEATLREAFLGLKALHPRHVHYKVCSTFDSSPAIGSIGRALEVGAEVFRSGATPVIGGAPALGRYCVFGNLFARADIGGGGKIHRLDRHPSMSRHPVTPATESDLRRLLAQQTTRRIELFDVLNLNLNFAASAQALQRVAADGAEVVLFDALEPAHVGRIGELLEGRARGHRTYFSVGPSSVEAALASRWRRRLPGAAPRLRPAAGHGRPILVASGSCSAVTEDQITWALANGFAGVGLDSAAALQAEELPAPDSAAAEAAIGHLRAGRSVILHTSRGAADPRMAAARELSRRQGLTQEQVTSRLGCALGLTVWRILAEARLPRLAIAGGDSSSYAARALAIESLEMIARLTPGAPLCRAHAPGSPVDGREIVFKGGQVGGRDYFGLLATGRKQSSHP